MDSSDDELESWSRKIEQHERQTRKWVWIWTLVPIIVAFLFLVYTVWQIAQAEGRLNQTEVQLKQATQQLATANFGLINLQTQIPAAQATVTAARATQVKLQADLSRAQIAIATTTADLSRIQRDLATATAGLGNARVYASNTCNIPADRLKYSMSNGSRESEILLYALKLQQEKVPWNAKGGFSIEEGFDSPRFALFVLQHVGLLSGITPDTLVWNALPHIGTPSDGDIVHYQAGYAMFFYQNLGVEVSEDGTSFREFDCVIGMTPLGIQVLKVNFAPIIEYSHLQ